MDVPPSAKAIQRMGKYRTDTSLPCQDPHGVDCCNVKTVHQSNTPQTFRSACDGLQNTTDSYPNQLLLRTREEMLQGGVVYVEFTSNSSTLHHSIAVSPFSLRPYLAEQVHLLSTPPALMVQVLPPPFLYRADCGPHDSGGRGYSYYCFSLTSCSTS